MIPPYISKTSFSTTSGKSEQYAFSGSQPLDDLFDSVDAVIIATPVWTHFDFVRKALEHNKHILCEKPMAQSYAL